MRQEVLVVVVALLVDLLALAQQQSVAAAEVMEAMALLELQVKLELLY
jgi:hypothetical protein